MTHRLGTTGVDEIIHLITISYNNNIINYNN